MRENVVEKYMVLKLKELGIEAVKFQPAHRVGMPDRLVLLPDARVVWVELKTDKGKLSQVQKYRHAELTRAGQRVVVLYNQGDVDEFIRDIKKGIP